MTAKKAAKKSAKVTHKEVKTDEVTNENDVNATITHADPEPEPMVGNLVVHEPVPLIDSVRAAWNEVRGTDAPFDECAPDFQRQLLYHADGVAKTGIVQQDDTYLAKFERALGSHDQRRKLNGRLTNTSRGATAAIAPANRSELQGCISSLRRTAVSNGFYDYERGHEFGTSSSGNGSEGHETRR